MKPYYETSLGKLYCGDCLEIMPELEPVDLVWTSPPYNLGKPTKGGMFNNQQGEKIEYDKYSDDKSGKVYIEWQRETIKTAFSTLKETGAIFYNHKPRIQKGVLDDRKNLIPLPIRQEIIWDRGSGFNYSGHFFVNTTERIFIICKDGWKPQKKYVKNGEVWRIAVAPGKERPYGHPAPFPLGLSKQVILSATKEQDVVLDNYMGSGTTAAACEELKRKWIGIEISEKYCEIAAKRIEKENQQLRLC